jgi:hypothetical protein
MSTSPSGKRPMKDDASGIERWRAIACASAGCAVPQIRVIFSL